MPVPAAARRDENLNCSSARVARKWRPWSGQRTNVMRRRDRKRASISPRWRANPRPAQTVPPGRRCCWASKRNSHRPIGRPPASPLDGPPARPPGRQTVRPSSYQSINQLPLILMSRPREQTAASQAAPPPSPSSSPSTSAACAALGRRDKCDSFALQPPPPELPEAGQVLPVRAETSAAAPKSAAEERAAERASERAAGRGGKEIEAVVSNNNPH